MGAIKAAGNSIVGSAATGGGTPNFGAAEALVPFTLLGRLNEGASQFDDYISGRAEEDKIEDAAAEAEAQQQEIQDLYRQQFETYLQMTEPYRQAGESFLPQLTELLGSEGRDQFMADALQSQEFQNIAGAATDQLVSNAAALGNRLSSGIQNDVLSTTGNLATQYAANAYNDRLNQLTQGVNLGLGALGTTLGGLNSSTAGIANSMGNIANINLQAQQAIAAQPNLLAGLAGAGIGGLIGGPQGASIGYGIGSQV